MPVFTIRCISLFVVWTIVSGRSGIVQASHFYGGSLQNNFRKILDILRELKISNGVGRNEDHIEAWLNENDRILATKENKLVIADWRYATNLTDTNADILSAVSVELAKWKGARVEEATAFLNSGHGAHNQTALRMLKTWVYGSDIPVAKSEKTVNKIANLQNDLSTIYGNAVIEKDGKKYNMEPELTKLMGESRDYDELLWAWKGWRDATGPKMKSKYTEVVSYMNEAARDHGLTDVGQSWRIANYELDNIEPMVDKLYQKILPLYKELHAYVRRKLSEKYSPEKVDTDGAIPAHILGNMWAQQWTDIFDLVVPFPNVATHDVTDALVAQGYTPKKMFELAEGFFTSIGLEPMTQKFWDHSMIVRPDDRPVQCHASATDFMTGDDFRIKMCTKVNMDYLQTIHHEMGHIEYFMQYRKQPTVFRTGANAAFHEAIGDTIALSVVTPAHLNTINLLPKKSRKSVVKSEENCVENKGTGGCLTTEKMEEINHLMKVALEKVAFLPFGYLIDKWRWEVFRGNINEGNYNAKWWEYRETFQGVKAPIPRSEEDFDPGAKYHVPAFVPYIRYFLSFVGQFQFQKSLCDAAGHRGPLNQCDIFRSEKAGKLLKSALSLGSSKPWPEVMEILTGQRSFTHTAIYEYFDPLYQWLKEQNASENVGW